jgi:hypothetical protein
MRAIVRAYVVAVVLIGLTPFPSLGQTAAEWRVTRLQVGGNNNNCGTDRGTMSIKGNVLSWTPQGFMYVVWKVELAPDGSADQIVPYETTPSRTIKVTVPAGTGPREIHGVQTRSACVYRYIPG